MLRYSHRGLVLVFSTPAGNSGCPGQLSLVPLYFLLVVQLSGVGDLMTSRATRARRARQILDSQHRRPFDFQAHSAARCLETVEARGRFLLEAPTGSGKTLIAQLSIAILAEELRDRLPRVLVVVPTRGLLVQHLDDAAWLGQSYGLGIHRIDPDTPETLFEAMIRGYGIVYTTPITLKNRLIARPAGASLLARFDFVVFDEIDTYLTVGELEERKDTWPALEMCCDAALPILGFTGTHLTVPQEQAWSNRSFVKDIVNVPADWLPFTRVQFVRVQDESVKQLDDRIRDELRRAYSLLLKSFGPASWSQIKRLAQQGNPRALEVLRLCGDRLRLFESPAHMQSKADAIVAEAGKRGPTLVLSRFRDSARFLEDLLPVSGSTVLRADGSMTREEIGEAMREFRAKPASTRASLVITRELGGRGLDFPSAARVVLASPRSNYQAVAQELARIRSRKRRPKRAIVTYFGDTEEQAKARRLGIHLSAEKFGKSKLFEVQDLPAGTYKLDPFESRTLAFEESIAGI
jgi:superfamily II DNA or RNA helicase